MSKIVILNEEQYKKLQHFLKEEMGIANEVNRISAEIENKLLQEIDILDDDKEGVFHVDELKVKWKLFILDKNINFNDWYLQNYNEYINGYSYDENTLYITILKINNSIDMMEIRDSIQHEVEHYYQTKNNKGTFSTDKYQKAIDNFDSNNLYLSYFSKLIYFSKKFEIDAYVNGAYNAIKHTKIKSYEEFLEKTNLGKLQELLMDISEVFQNLRLNTLEFYTLKDFIIKNKFISFSDDKKLKKRLIKLSQDSYDYFLKKTARAWVLIDRKNKNEAISVINGTIKHTKIK